MQLDPDFAALLAGHDLDELDRDRSSIVGVSADLRIRYVNDGWRDFAARNGGEVALARWPLGTPLLEAIGGELREFYRGLYQAALDAGEPVGLEYECSSPDERRTFHMHVFPLQRRGLLITHTLHHAQPHPGRDDAHPDATIAEYRQANGLAVQCANCRRWRHPTQRRWDWVPHLLHGAWRDVSHGLCEPCVGYYYPR